MKHYFDFNTPVCNAAVAFGRFDGMHIGHRAVIRKLSSYRNSVLISFEDNYNQIIYSEVEKEYVACTMNLENMITVRADKYENMNLCKFVKDCLVCKLNTKTIVAGENYERLKELRDVCAENGIALDVVPTVTENGKEVTTALIKKSFNEDDMNNCLRLLGGSYIMAGSVVHGKGDGSKHGIPTANIALEKNKLWPKYGVYGTFVHLRDSKWRGATNVGLRPSADDIPIPTCETLILGLNKLIYDTPLVLEAFVYIRPVMKFKNLDELSTQIKKDIAQIDSCYHMVIGK